MSSWPTPHIVDIPGQPGKKIDARILPDLQWIIEKYKVKVNDGYAPTGHTPGGEHPHGLAVDLVPDTAKGGTWDDVDALAHAAEPTQNAPKKPFRWVGYTGDHGHGRNDHLHLSWDHEGETVATMKDSGGSNLSKALDAVSSQGGPTGAIADMAKTGADAGGAVVDAAAGAAAAAAKAMLGLLWDLFGEEGARIALYIALVAGGTVLAVVGLKRTIGVKGPSIAQVAQVAEVTPAGRGAKAAGAAAGAGKAAA